MEYLLLIYSDESIESNLDDAGRQQLFADYMKYTEELNEAGVMKGGNALKPISTATTVRVREDKSLTTDGPFAETKEQLGGFYLIDCETLDEALAWAAKIPTAKHGSIEVRPILEY